MARYIAKNIVAAGLADSAEVQLAYAIGVANPVSVTVSTEGTAVIPEDQIAELVREHFPLTPRGIIKHLDLLPPDLQADRPPRPLRPQARRRTAASPGKRPTRPTPSPRPRGSPITFVGLAEIRRPVFSDI